MIRAGEVVIVDFPGVAGIKRRPAVILSSDIFHESRPDIIIGLVTSQTAGATTPTDALLQDWAATGLRLPSAFRAFLVTLPRTAAIGAWAVSKADWVRVRDCTRKALAHWGTKAAYTPTTTRRLRAPRSKETEFKKRLEELQDGEEV